MFSLSAISLLDLKQTADTSIFFTKESQSIEKIIKYEKIFGGDRILIAASPTQVKGISQDLINSVKTVHQAMENQPGVKKIRSLFSTKVMRGTDGSLEIEDIAAMDDAQHDIDQVMRDLKSNRMYAGTIAALGYDSLAVVIEFKGVINEPILVDTLEETLRQNDLETWSISGLSYINTQIKYYMDKDLQRLVPLFILLVAVILVFSFGRISGVVLPLLNIAFSIVVTLGLMAAFGVHINVITNTIPMLVIAIGSAYSIHFISHYQFDETVHDVSSRVRRTFFAIVPTILLAGLTTMAGLFSNSFSEIPGISQFGYFITLAIFIVLVGCMTLTPVGLMVFDKKRNVAKLSNSKQSFTQVRFFKPIARFSNAVSVRWKVPCLAVLTLIAIYFGLQIPHIISQYKTLSYFRDDSSIVQQADFISKHYGGYISYNIVIDGGKPDAILEPEVMRIIDGFDAWRDQKYPGLVKSSQAIAEPIKVMSREINDDEKFYQVPTSFDETYQYIEVYSWSSDFDKDLGHIISPNYRYARLNGRFAFGPPLPGENRPDEKSVVRYNQITQEMVSYFKERLPDNFLVEYYGDIPTWSVINTKIINSQIKSIIIALGLIFLITAALLRSWYSGIVAMFPVIFALIIHFGVMAVLKINLDIATSLVSTMALGIGIDDTIHFINTYRKNFKLSGDVQHALTKTFHTAGTAILITSVTLIAGFLVLSFSQFLPIYYFAILNALAIFSATIGALFLLPSLIALTPHSWQKRLF